MNICNKLHFECVPWLSINLTLKKDPAYYIFKALYNSVGAVVPG